MKNIYARKDRGEIMQVARVRNIGVPADSRFGYETSLFCEEPWVCSMNMPIFGSEDEAHDWIRNSDKWTILEPEEAEKILAGVRQRRV